ncbi:GyrI-like domain-containing protein [Algoriphagus sp. H41]|uniref:GyrI-like domain-containing protein n=1 Tax=Algoriphagus oliviformis TaxID=2811231 RepID=A0ABS3C2V6_9BACT|nr:GyrI-like domain-containing protein [Algoriphagus oliviformis]MBN7811448.1 GyrI-like domain-containing protein [Algoriphagus oliviformis]
MQKNFSSPRIETLTEKKLVGSRLSLSLTNNRTAELWRAFMPRRDEVAHALSRDLISMQLYPASYFAQFDPATSFEKWAAVEVSDFAGVPAGMETFVLPGGRYAVFDYRGSSRDTSIFQYIFTQWLPSSGYVLDERPHFEVLGEKYKNDDLDSEEEIWIPVRSK